MRICWCSRPAISYFKNPLLIIEFTPSFSKTCLYRCYEAFLSNSLLSKALYHKRTKLNKKKLFWHPVMQGTSNHRGLQRYHEGWRCQAILLLNALKFEPLLKYLCWKVRKSLECLITHSDKWAVMIYVEVDEEGKQARFGRSALLKLKHGRNFSITPLPVVMTKRSTHSLCQI